MRNFKREIGPDRRTTFSIGSRSGAVTVEAAISLLVLLSILFAMFDMGLMVFQSNLLSLAARRAAREAIVRGSGIDPASAWGPNQVTATASDGSAVAAIVSPYCVTMKTSGVNIVMTWPDGTNQVDDQVTVKLSYQRSAMTPLTSWMGTIKLNANATMQIVH